MRRRYYIISMLVWFIFVFVLLFFPTHTESSIIEEPEDSVIEKEDTLEITLYTKDIELIAKTVWGEARGCSTIEQSAVIWCILNRVDAGYGTIEDVVTAPYQFVGYKEDNPVLGEFIELTTDVLIRWQAEKYCIGDVGRTLPDTYLWFHGDGKHNIFRDAFSGDYHIWDWECLNPYP